MASLSVVLVVLLLVLSFQSSSSLLSRGSDLVQAKDNSHSLLAAPDQLSQSFSESGQLSQVSRTVCHHRGDCSLCSADELNLKYCQLTGRKQLKICHVHSLDLQLTNATADATVSSRSNGSQMDSHSRLGSDSWISTQPNLSEAKVNSIIKRDVVVGSYQVYESCHGNIHDQAASFWFFEGVMSAMLVLSIIVMWQRKKMIDSIHQHRLDRLFNS